MICGLLALATTGAGCSDVKRKAKASATATKKTTKKATRGPAELMVDVEKLQREIDLRERKIQQLEEEATRMTRESGPATDLGATRRLRADMERNAERQEQCRQQIEERTQRVERLNRELEQASGR